MSRAIKCRAHYNGKVLPVYRIQFDEQGNVERVELVDTEGRTEYAWERATVYHVGSESIVNVSIMQFTGLTDKNGRNIYEGDVLKDDDGWTVTVEAGFSTPSISIFLGQVSDCNSPTLFSKADHLEIIGNIYEKQDLLKEREDG